jgi:hypothetical protein
MNATLSSRLRHRLNRLAVPALLALMATAPVAGPAEAASLSLIPSAGEVTQGSSFTVDLFLDAQDAPGSHPGLYGGHILVSFDPALLDFAGFTTAGGVSLFAPVATGSSGGLATLSLGFENAGDLGVVGSFSFTAIGNAGSLVQIGLADYDDFFGSFIAYVPTDKPFYPDFEGTSVSISTVPLPPGAWLLGSALAALGFRARRRPQAEAGPGQG